MATRTQRGFTLVEMLVVITIIGALMALLLPAIKRIQASGQAVACMNNQTQLAKAVVLYETAKKRYPGYVEYLINHYAGWPAVVTETVRPDLWPNWRRKWGGEGVPPTDGTGKWIIAATVDLFHCPGDTASTEDWALSYVANCGQPDAISRGANALPPDWGANGVFHNHDTRKLGGEQVINVSSAGMADGTQHTLMLGENIQAGQWTDPYRMSGQDGSFNLSDLFSPPVEATLGMVWFPVDPPPSKSAQINVGAQEAGSDPVFKPPAAGAGDGGGGGANWQYYKWARPSGSHGDFAIVVFCDSHATRLRSSIEYRVYAQLMSTDGQNVHRAGVNEKGKTMPPDWYRPIGEDDL